MQKHAQIIIGLQLLQKAGSTELRFYPEESSTFEINLKHRKKNDFDRHQENKEKKDVFTQHSQKILGSKS